MSLDSHDIIKFIDRTTNYQSWFIPLIWLYWPTKANKRQNRSRKWAIDQLSRSGAEGHESNSKILSSLEASEDGTRTGDDGTVDSPDRFSNDGYSSLDGDQSFLDNRGTSHVDNDGGGASQQYLEVPSPVSGSKKRISLSRFYTNKRN